MGFSLAATRLEASSAAVTSAFFTNPPSMRLRARNVRAEDTWIRNLAHGAAAHSLMRSPGAVVQQLGREQLALLGVHVRAQRVEQAQRRRRRVDPGSVARQFAQRDQLPLLLRVLEPDRLGA